MSTVVHAVDWDDPTAAELRQEMEAELSVRYAELFAQRPELVESDANDVHAEAVVRTVVVAQGGQTVGHAALVRREDGELEVKRVYVRPEHRRAGLSGRLLAALEEAGRDAGGKRLILSTGPLQPEAAAAYHALGWTRIAPYVPPEWSETALCFEKRL